MEGCGVALITGGTKGIGLATAQEMVELGYRDFILGYHRDDEAARLSKVSLEKSPGVKVVLIKGDVADKSTVEAHYKAVDEDFNGRLFAILHTAGKVVKLNQEDSTEDKFDKYVEMYGKSLWRLVEKGVPYLEQSSHGGRIIALSNPGVNLMSPPRSAYFLPGCSKAALEYMVRSYAVDLAPKRITCNIVIPGITQTNVWEAFGLTPSDVEGMAERRCPMKKVIQPRDVGAAIAFLASRKANFITGAMLPVDGGLLFAGPAAEIPLDT